MVPMRIAEDENPMPALKRKMRPVGLLMNPEKADRLKAS